MSATTTRPQSDTGTVTCPKCKSRTVSARYRAGFDPRLHRWALEMGRIVESKSHWPAPPPSKPKPIESCSYGQCPAAEHLHRRCKRCRFQWTTPIAGGVLGLLITKMEPDAPPLERDPGHPPIRPAAPQNRQIREGDSGPRVAGEGWRWPWWLGGTR